MLLALIVVVVAVLALAGCAPRARTVVAGARRRRLCSPRLLNPVAGAEERSYIDDVAVVVVDDSASQQIGDRAEQTAAALAEVEKRIHALAHVELRVVRAGADSTTRQAASGTRLFEALARALGRRAGAPHRRRRLHHRRPGA